MTRWHRAGTPILDLAFAPDGMSLFEGERNGRIVQWNLPVGSTGRQFADPDPVGSGHQRATIDPGMSVNQMRLSPDGGILARARNDGLIDLWDVPAGRWIDWLDCGATGPAAIDFSPDGNTLVAQFWDSCVLWDVQTRQLKRTKVAERFYPAVRFSPDGTVIAHGAEGCVQFLDAVSGNVLTENRAPRTAGMGMVFHPGGSIFFASALEPSIKLWDTRTGHELLSLQKHTALIRSLLLTPDGNTLISSDQSGTVLSWDLTYYNDRIRRELAHRASQGAGQ